MVWILIRFQWFLIFSGDVQNLQGAVDGMEAGRRLMRKVEAGGRFGAT